MHDTKGSSKVAKRKSSKKLERLVETKNVKSVNSSECSNNEETKRQLVWKLWQFNFDAILEVKPTIRKTLKVFASSVKCFSWMNGWKSFRKKCQSKRCVPTNYFYWLPFRGTNFEFSSWNDSFHVKLIFEPILFFKVQKTHFKVNKIVINCCT